MVGKSPLVTETLGPLRAAGLELLQTGQLPEWGARPRSGGPSLLGHAVGQARVSGHVNRVLTLLAEHRS